MDEEGKMLEPPPGCPAHAHKKPDSGEGGAATEPGAHHPHALSEAHTAADARMAAGTQAVAETQAPARTHAAPGAG